MPTYCGPYGGRAIGGNDQLPGEDIQRFYKGYNAGIRSQFDKTAKMARAALAAVPASNNHNKGAKHMEAAVIRPTLYTRHPDGFRSVDGSTFVPVPAPTTLETNLLGDHLCHACDGACDCCQPDECVTCSRCGKAVLAFKEATNDNK
jgi:hypothetical protein